jgi:diaminopimelate epimerase
MQKINFTKMVASGNDFVLIKLGYPVIRLSGYPSLAKNICDRKFGVGADGLLILEKSKIADIKMRIFNADGSEAQMCGNGARCVALYLSKRKVKIETKAGIIVSEVNDDSVKIKLTDPKNIKLNIPIIVNNRQLKVNFINTGVPHTVIFVEGLDKIDVVGLGRQIRYHRHFAPAGTNVDFVEPINNNSLKIRTYERGVEDETLACGTGAVASALLTTYHLPLTTYGRINVYTKSGEVLKVYFNRINNRFQNVWLEGKARIVYTGQIFIIN